MRTLKQNDGFTLFELVLSIALSAALLVLVGAAINLYLLECDAGRAEVEQAQLARAVVGMITADLRATIVHKPQDVSVMAEVIRNSGEDNSDSGGGGGSRGASGASSEDGSSGASDESESDDGTTPSIGLYGNLNELVMDISRSNHAWIERDASGEETAAADTSLEAVGDICSVRYFVREGEQVAYHDVLTTGLDLEAQQRLGGLVRQEVDRAARTLSLATGGDSLVDSPGKLVASEVAEIELRYFDGQQIQVEWDTDESGGLPLAVEISVWIRVATSLADTAVAGTDGPTEMYRTTVYLPASVPMSGDELAESGNEQQ